MEDDRLECLITVPRSGTRWVAANLTQSGHRCVHHSKLGYEPEIRYWHFFEYYPPTMMGVTLLRSPIMVLASHDFDCMDPEDMFVSFERQIEFIGKGGQAICLHRGMEDIGRMFGFDDCREHTQDSIRGDYPLKAALKAKDPTHRRLWKRPAWLDRWMLEMEHVDLFYQAYGFDIWWRDYARKAG